VIEDPDINELQGLAQPVGKQLRAGTARTAWQSLEERGKHAPPPGPSAPTSAHRRWPTNQWFGDRRKDVGPIGVEIVSLSEKPLYGVQVALFVRGAPSRQSRRPDVAASLGSMSEPVIKDSCANPCFVAS
jgi:hypothetical protein